MTVSVEAIALDGHDQINDALTPPRYPQGPWKGLAIPCVSRLAWRDLKQQRGGE